MRRQWYLWAGIAVLFVIASAAVAYFALAPASQRIAAVQPPPPRIDRLKWKFELLDSAREFIDENARNAPQSYRTEYVNGLTLSERWLYPKISFDTDKILIYEGQSQTSVYDMSESQVSEFEARHGRYQNTPEYTVAINEFNDGVIYAWHDKVTALNVNGDLLWCELNPSAELLALFEPRSAEMDPVINTAMNPVMGPMFAECADGLTRILTQDNCLIARDQSGNEVWRTPIEEDSPNSLWMFDFELGADNSVYLMSRAWQQIQAVGPAGDFRWKLYGTDIFPLGEKDDRLEDHYPNQKLELGMAGGRDGTAFVRSEGGSVAALDYDGNVKWCYRLPEAAGRASYSVGTPVVGPDSSVYVRGLHGLVFAIAPDGQRKWAVTLPDSHETTELVLGPDGTVYVIVEAALYALEP